MTYTNFVENMKTKEDYEFNQEEVDKIWDQLVYDHEENDLKKWRQEDHQEDDKDKFIDFIDSHIDLIKAKLDDE